MAFGAADLAGFNGGGGILKGGQYVLCFDGENKLYAVGGAVMAAESQGEKEAVTFSLPGELKVITRT